ncbi:unnamed protein product [Rotaria sp. Silwood2]|nr:unnamed protein product [Rotaria sp. Silwood2]
MSVLAAITTSTSPPSITIAFWSFDYNTRELYNTGLDGVLVGDPTYTTSRLGYGAAISLNQSSSQFVSITTRNVPLNSRSFTIEAWIYPIALTVVDYGIFGQCQSQDTNLYFHFLSRNIKLYCGFWGNDVSGATTLTMNVWTDVACVYDSATFTQQVWLNGVLDGSRSASADQGTSGAISIGLWSHEYFNGYINEVRFKARAKTATELLNDATLFVYYSFDDGSLIDDSFNGIKGTVSGNITMTAGRVNQAIQFTL